MFCLKIASGRGPQRPHALVGGLEMGRGAGRKKNGGRPSKNLSMQKRLFGPKGPTKKKELKNRKKKKKRTEWGEGKPQRGALYIWQAAGGPSWQRKTQKKVRKDETGGGNGSLGAEASKKKEVLGLMKTGEPGEEKRVNKKGGGAEGAKRKAYGREQKTKPFAGSKGRAKKKSVKRLAQKRSQKKKERNLGKISVKNAARGARWRRLLLYWLLTLSGKGKGGRV